MVDDNKGGKDRGTKDRHSASEKDKKSRRTDGDHSGKDDGELAPTRRKGEPAGNLRRRAEWFQKRHGSGQ